MNRKVKNIFCLVRPPGHHALNTGEIEGFCFYNHIAVTAKYIQIKYKISKVLIVDWDYHHGNSTEHFFYNDPSVFFFLLMINLLIRGLVPHIRKEMGMDWVIM
jgi:acetoin utilization deacetylase AcuC-like enzyme